MFDVDGRTRTGLVRGGRGLRLPMAMIMMVVVAVMVVAMLMGVRVPLRGRAAAAGAVLIVAMSRQGAVGAGVVWRRAMRNRHEES